MDDVDPLGPMQTPTAKRPLLGMTVLVVEDSRYASEAMRLMCLRSGARIRRADSLRAARRHLKVYRPSAVIVDLGLPDGSGLELIEELSQCAPRVGVLLATSGESDAEQAALDAGADAFLPKPMANLATFQQAILSVLPADRQPIDPSRIEDQLVRPDPLAYRDDMAHVVTLLDDGRSGPMLDYIAQFSRSVAASAEDSQLQDAATELSAARRNGGSSQVSVARLAGLVQERVNERLAI